MANETKRVRRTDEQLIQDLEARITALKTRATQRKAKRSPALSQTVKAVKSIDAALADTEDAAMRTALSDARATLSACLALQGIISAAGSGERPASGRRSAQDVEQIAELLRTDTKTMRLPMQKLIADKKIRTKGNRRGMTYFAA